MTNIVQQACSTIWLAVAAEVLPTVSFAEVTQLPVEGDDDEQRCMGAVFDSAARERAARRQRRLRRKTQRRASFALWRAYVSKADVTFVVSGGEPALGRRVRGC